MSLHAQPSLLCDTNGNNECNIYVMTTESQTPEINEDTVSPHSIHIEPDLSAVEEVADIVPNTDDPDMLCLTFRSLLIGLVFNCAFTIGHQYSQYTNYEYIDQIFVLLLSYPLGIALAFILPRRTIIIRNWMFSLNPGKFTIKEHVLIYSMVSSSFSTFPYILAIIDVKRVYAEETVNFAVGLILIISTQLMGLGIAGQEAFYQKFNQFFSMHFVLYLLGIMRRFLVWPSGLIWPGNLPAIALFRVLHKRSSNSSTTRRIGRLWLYVIAALCQAVYYWLPGYIMPVLTAFSFICMIQPSNAILSQLTGVYGLAMGALVLDWHAITTRLLSPIVVPRYALVNILFGFLLFVWMLTPIFYYTNVWNGKMFPISSDGLYDSNGNEYNVSIILDGSFRLNETAYQIYGLFYMSTLRTLSYGIRFAWLSSLVIYTVLYHGKAILKQLRTPLFHPYNDIHCRLMAKYPEVPEWWYTIVFISSFIATAVTCHISDFMPWYYLLLAVPIGFFLILPIGIIAAETNQYPTTNISVNFIGGILLLGYSIGFATFRVIVIAIQNQTLNLLLFLKLSHYMKIPPRKMFLAIISGTIISCLCRYVFAHHLFATIAKMCQKSNKLWSCPNTHSFYSNSIRWGVIGPSKIYGLYSSLLWFFLIGAASTVVSWLIQKRFSKIEWLKYIHFPLIFYVADFVPDPVPAGNVLSWLVLGFIFYLIIPQWWRDRYALLFSIAMDTGVALSSVIISYALTNRKINFPNWWGLGDQDGDVCPLSHKNYTGQ